MNTPTYIIIGIIFWAVCGFVSYGRMNAYWVRAYPTLPHNRTRVAELLAAMLGPIALLAAEAFLRCSSYHGPQGFLL